MKFIHIFVLAATACGSATAQCTLTLNPAAIHVSAASTTGSFAVNANSANCPRTPKSNSAWILVAYGQSGNGASGTVGYTIDKSTLYTPRTGSISVNNTQFTVTQDAYPCTYNFTPANTAIQPAGGNFSLAIATACTWTASTAASWISLNAGSGTTGNGSLSYTVAPNTAVATRTGAIQINNQMYTCDAVRHRVQLHCLAADGKLPLNRRSGPDHRANRQFLFLDSPESRGLDRQHQHRRQAGGTQSGNATLSYTLAANNTSQSRTGTLTVAGQSVALSQAGVGILFTAQSVVNGASFQSGQIAPGELITIFGSGLGPSTPAGLQLTSDGQYVTTSLSGTRVLFDGTAAPVTYASDGQVNAIVPFAVAGAVSTQVQVEAQGVASSPVTEFLASSSPAIFTASGGAGQGAVLNQDNTANSSGNPAPTGSVLQIFATGGGQTNPPGVDGQLAGSDPSKLLAAITATLGGVDAPVQYYGSSSGLVAGVFQVNILIPLGAPKGTAIPIVLKVGGNPSPSGVTVAIQ